MAKSKDQSLPAFAIQRFRSVCRIIIFLLAEALLYVVWLLITWLLAVVAHFFLERGLVAWAAEGFKIAGSAGVLCMAVMHTICDIWMEFKHLRKEAAHAG